MSITTTACFLKSSSSPPPRASVSTNHKPKSPPAKPGQIIPRHSDRSLAIRSVSFLACAIIGSELSTPIHSFSNNLALATEELTIETQLQTPPPKVAEKWSDKRSCPAWEMNSLETIVPENLPRPSAKRRWEIVGFQSREAPAIVRIRVFRSGNGCFSM